MSEKLNVLLIQPSTHKSIDKEYISTQLPLNLCYIAASLKDECANIKIIDYCVEAFNESEFLAILEQFKPAVAGFGSFTASVCSVEEIARIVKRYDDKILTVLGGVHISALPERTLSEMPSIDIGVIGEGEVTIKEIYHALLRGNSLKTISGIVYREGPDIKGTKERALITNLDEVPFPSRHLIDIEKYRNSHVSRGFSRRNLRIMEIITSRGCPNHCIFCAGHINYCYTLRFRSYENIVEEIESLRRNYKVNHISIEDDTFTINKELVSQLCAYFKKKRISWNCNSRVNTVNYELLKNMKESGCKKVSFGVETGSPRIARLIKKNITLGQVRQAFKWARRAGIRYVEGTFILGSHPDETLHDIRMTEKLIFELMPDFIAVSIICPFPGTEIFSMMVKNKQLQEPMDWSAFTFMNNKPAFKKLNNISADQLISLQKKIIRKYYSSFSYIKNQILKIRSLGECLYFLKLGYFFALEFLLRKSSEDSACS